MPSTALEFAGVVERAITDMGGVDLARRGETAPAVREDVRRMLTATGVDDVEAASGLEAACVAGELSRLSGAFALPFPLVAWLSRVPGSGRPLALVDPTRPRVEHGDIDLDWLLASVDATAWRKGTTHRRRPVELAPFAAVVELMPDGSTVSECDIALALTLDAWRILGALERAHDLARRHVGERQQFGRKLAGFQAVRFQVADVAVAVRGLRRLCQYTLWQLFPYRRTGLVDALALRVAALERARTVLAATHQLLGALGFCDEHDLSIIDRHIQGSLRIPCDSEATMEQLLRCIAGRGFPGLFGVQAEGVGT